MSMNSNLLLLIAAVILTAVASLSTPNPIITGDFTANITVNEQGLKYSGYIVSHSSGYRFFRFIKELNETTYVFQDFHNAQTYSYTIMNSGCTCQVTPGGIIGSMFASLSSAQKSTKPCNQSSGTLYTNNLFQGLPGAPQSDYCIDGTTPKYVSTGQHYTIFSNFVAGPPATFPVEPMNSWVEDCAGQCI